MPPPSKFRSLPLAVAVGAGLLLGSCATPPAEVTMPAAPAPITPGLPFGQIRFTGPRVDQTPVPVFMPSPFELQSEFARRNLKGEALIGFVVSTEGKPERIKILNSTDSGLAQSSAAFVSRMVFKPATVAGTPIACDAEMPFSQK